MKPDPIAPENKPQILLVRKDFSDVSTIGEMYFEGTFQCYTLEDTCRRKKIRGITAIPSGTYEIILSYSNRFKYFLPLLLRVPQFTGIRIHAGNKPEDTEGCILVGETKEVNFIGQSRKAMRELMPKIEAFTKREKVFVEVRGGFQFEEGTKEKKTLELS